MHTAISILGLCPLGLLGHLAIDNDAIFCRLAYSSVGRAAAMRLKVLPQRDDRAPEVYTKWLLDYFRTRTSLEDVNADFPHRSAIDKIRIVDELRKRIEGKRNTIEELDMRLVGEASSFKRHPGKENSFKTNMGRERRDLEGYISLWDHIHVGHLGSTQDEVPSLEKHTRCSYYDHDLGRQVEQHYYTMSTTRTAAHEEVENETLDLRDDQVRQLKAKRIQQFRWLLPTELTRKQDGGRQHNGTTGSTTADGASSSHATDPGVQSVLGNGKTSWEWTDKDEAALCEAAASGCFEDFKKKLSVWFWRRNGGSSGASPWHDTRKDQIDEHSIGRLRHDLLKAAAYGGNPRILKLAVQLVYEESGTEKEGVLGTESFIRFTQIYKEKVDSFNRLVDWMGSASFVEDSSQLRSQLVELRRLHSNKDDIWSSRPAFDARSTGKTNQGSSRFAKEASFDFPFLRFAAKAYAEKKEEKTNFRKWLRLDQISHSISSSEFFLSRPTHDEWHGKPHFPSGSDVFNSWIERSDSRCCMMQQAQEPRLLEISLPTAMRNPKFLERLYAVGTAHEAVPMAAFREYVEEIRLLEAESIRDAFQAEFAKDFRRGKEWVDAAEQGGNQDVIDIVELLTFKSTKCRS